MHSPYWMEGLHSMGGPSALSCNVGRPHMCALKALHVYLHVCVCRVCTCPWHACTTCHVEMPRFPDNGYCAWGCMLFPPCVSSSGAYSSRPFVSCFSKRVG